MLLTLMYLALCAWLNRWRGTPKGKGLNIGWSSTIQRIVLCFVLSIPAIIASPAHGIVIMLLLFWPGFAMGWGEYFDLSDKENKEPEVRWIDYATKGLRGIHRDYIAMSLRGLHFTVPTAIVGALVNPLTLLYAPLGLGMALCYWLPKKHGLNQVVFGEILFGILLGAIMFDMGLLMGV